MPSSARRQGSATLLNEDCARHEEGPTGHLLSSSPRRLGPGQKRIGRSQAGHCLARRKPVAQSEIRSARADHSRSVPGSDQAHRTRDPVDESRSVAPASHRRPLGRSPLGVTVRASIRKVHWVLRQALSWANRRGYASLIATEGVELPPLGERKIALPFSRDVRADINHLLEEHGVDGAGGNGLRVRQDRRALIFRRGDALVNYDALRAPP